MMITQIEDIKITATITDIKIKNQIENSAEISIEVPEVVATGNQEEGSMQRMVQKT